MRRGNSVFPDLNIVVSLVQTVVVVTHMGECIVFTGYPVNILILIFTAQIIAVHGSQLLTVNRQIHHIGAICIDLVGQSIGISTGRAETVICQLDAVAMALGAVTVAQSDDVIAAVQIGSIQLQSRITGGEQHGITGPGGSLPLDDPRTVMHQDHGMQQPIVIRRILAIGAASAKIGDCIVGVAKLRD